jgi:hypothetical protein
VAQPHEAEKMIVVLLERHPMQFLAHASVQSTRR